MSLLACEAISGVSKFIVSWTSSKKNLQNQCHDYPSSCKVDLTIKAFKGENVSYDW